MSDYDDWRNQQIANAEQHDEQSSAERPAEPAAEADKPTSDDTSEQPKA